MTLKIDVHIGKVVLVKQDVPGELFETGVGVTGGLLGETGERVGDTGELVGDTAELVGETGVLIGAAGNEVEDVDPSLRELDLPRPIARGPAIHGRADT